MLSITARYREVKMAKEKKVESKTSKIVNLVIMIIEIMVIIAGITFSIIMITGNKSTTDELGTGTNITAVLSDSMDGPITDKKIKSFKIGDLLIVKNIRSNAEAQAELQIGDVITYTGVGPDGSYGLISHRIIQIETQKLGDEEITFFWTLGDKQYTGNEEIDMYNSKRIIGADIQGVVTGQVSKIGYAIIWFQNSTNFLVSVVVPLALLLIYNLYVLIKMVVDYKIKKVNAESQKLESIFEKIFSEKKKEDLFEIGFECNNDRLLYSDEAIKELSSLLDNSAVLKITNGSYSEKDGRFTYKLNNVPYTLSLKDIQISGLSVFKERFTEKNLFDEIEIRNTTCGDFKFNFFVFDFAADKESAYYLDKKDKETIKEHRIYLYRDHIRVAPYGDPDNDWLEIDKKRGVGRAGDYLSNDQVVGFVDISKQGNPRLKDKTNREGLIEEGNATRDFIVLLHSFLLFIRQHAYRQYQEKVKQQKEQQINKLRVVDNQFSQLKESIGENTKALSAYNELYKSYQIEKKFYQNRLDNTEDLAAVGLSVETASHDMSMMLTKGVDAIDNLIKDIDGGVLTDEQIENELHSIRGMFSFVKDQMRDIQLMFKSSKQRRRPIRFEDLLEKVEKIYKRTLNREHIEYSVNKIGSPIIAKCTDAVILQLLINLFDNAVYWLAMPDIVEKRITITLDGNNQQVIFSDNGPGIRDDDKPYIFEAFYSGKEDGRGLGLYIARQLLQRMGYSILLAEIPSEQILSGANFVINFVNPEEND